MVPRACNMINQEGNNTPSTLNLQENNEKSLIDTRKTVKDDEVV